MITRSKLNRCKWVARITRRYPLVSGCGKLANSRLVEIAASPPNEDAWTDVEGGRALVPLGDHIGRSMFFVGDLDRKVSWVVDNCVQRGGVVLDIGANLGLVSQRLAARVGPRGHVHAFEPNPRMQRYLKETIAA
jgi:hypothetical protein